MMNLGRFTRQVLGAVLVAGAVLAPSLAPSASWAQGAAAKPPATPYTKKHLYDEQTDPRQDIAAALKQAQREHKRVIVDFGGDWCGDCQVLDIYFHQSPNAELLAKHFVLVHVFIGHIDKNLEIPEGYGLPIKKGVPALAVLDRNGKVLYAQHGEFEDMRHMDARSVTEFLDKWKE
jgi:thiol:disulfide interchange protein